MIDRLILFCLRHRQFIKILLILTTLAILLLTTLPSRQFGESDLYSYDKVGHFLVFFGWTFLFGLFMFTRNRTETRFVLVFIVGCLFGVTTEVFQEILPINRNMDMMDLYADFLASLSAIIFLFFIKRRCLSKEMQRQLKKI